MTPSVPSDWTALYLPGRPGADPSRRGFPTAEAAWTYVGEQACSTCSGLHGDAADSPCGAEWVVVPTDKIEEGVDLHTLLELADFEGARG